MDERLTADHEAEIRARVEWVLAYLQACRTPRVVTELRTLVGDAALLLAELDSLRREGDEARARLVGRCACDCPDDGRDPVSRQR